ncbi:MAG: ribonuclease P protein component [Planctomycetes bacterium]|nr:ribonuclease P protein component [Planctomycetota bacterium]
MHEYVADNKLRKEEKLLTRAQFDVVFKGGRSAGNKRLVVHCIENQLGHPRLGLVVSTRFGNAVERNRFKRRIREVFRTHKSDIGSHDVVVLPSKRPESRTSTFDELGESLMKLIQKLASSDVQPT